ncbi:MAG TPA: hypothetical protein VF867_00035 [Arthrobacter sp.]
MTELESTTRPFLTGGETAGRRFLTIDQTARELDVSEHPTMTLVRDWELCGIWSRGCGLWRVGVLGAAHFIEQAYGRTASRIASGEIDFAGMEQREARTNGRN